LNCHCQWRSQKFQLGASSPFPSPTFPNLSLFPSLLPSPSLTLPSPPLEVGLPKIQLGALGERCESPQRGLGRSRSRNQIWCILALKMRPGGSNFNHFKLTKLANFVQFKRMLMFCLEDWGGLGPLPPGYATGYCM